MLKRFLVVLVIAGLAVIPSATGAEKSEQPRNIILVGWDGAQRDHIKECLSRNELATLKKLSEEGAFVEIDVEGTTDTKAGWSQILSGYYPTVTGVYSNGRYQPVPKGLSIFERLEKHFGADDFVTGAVIGKKGHCGEIDPPKKTRLDAESKKGTEKEVQPGAGQKLAGWIIEEDGVKYRFVPGSPYYNMYTAMEVWDFGLMEDEKVGTRALELLEKYKDKPFFFFVHFASVDHQGHKFSENSKEYNGALISNDQWTGKIVQKLKDLGLYDKTLIYVTADHGFDEDKTSHSNAPFVFVATNDKKVIRNGLRQDITPTILERFGLDLAKIEPPLNGVPLTKPYERGKVQLGRESEYAKPKDEQAAKKKAMAEGKVSVTEPALNQPVKAAKRAAAVQQAGQGRFAQIFDRWFEELIKAHKENDREKIDQLIKQMQQQREKMKVRKDVSVGQK